MKLGATRTGVINWTCWSWEDLDYLMPHFLAHGKTVMIEWGWVYDENTLRKTYQKCKIEVPGEIR